MIIFVVTAPTQEELSNYDPGKYIKESQHNIHDDSKMLLLNERWTPPPGFCFPKTGGRKYNIAWESEYTWLRYSVSEDAAFCVYCLLFGDTTGTGVHLASFQSIGFHDWKNAKGAKRGALPSHELTEIHKCATMKALAFKDIAAGRSKDIRSCLSSSYQDQVKNNRAILLSIIDVIISLGQRNIPFRGHGWNKVTKREDGNFDFFLNWKAQFDPCLQRHLESCKKNASYKSPDIQNEIIHLAGMEVRDSILSEIRSAGWYSLMADECTDVATIEQMSICIRFVDDKPEVREEFLGFVKLDSADAVTISASLLSFLSSCNLDLSHLRGQGYDGASVMAGKVSGVSARILEEQPRAMYVHCRAHNLNLVVSSSCKQVPEIRNLFDSLGALTWFLGASAKRKAILKRHLKSDDISSLIVETEDAEVDIPSRLVKESSSRQVPRLCETRWSARVSTLSSVIAKYKAIYNALKDISLESSNADARTKADSFTRLLMSSGFIVALFVAQFILSFSHPLCLALQKTDCDIIKAYQNARHCRTIIAAQRNECKFKELWKEAEIVATEVEIELSKPRTPRSSIYRSNACTGSDAESYFRMNVYYPFVDHCIMEFDNRFPDSSEAMFIGYKLLPSLVSCITSDEVSAIETFYGPDMPNKTLFHSELEVWKAKCLLIHEQTDLINALKHADREFFPNIYTVLKLMLTLPVGAVPCERSFSAMRRLKDWSRSTMTDNRLCGLALLYTHRDMNINKEHIINRFDSSGHRRIGSLTL